MGNDCCISESAFTYSSKLLIKKIMFFQGIIALLDLGLYNLLRVSSAPSLQMSPFSLLQQLLQHPVHSSVRLHQGSLNARILAVVQDLGSGDIIWSF